MGHLNADPDGFARAGLGDPAARARLEGWLATALDARRVTLERAERLSGGAIQQNLALTLLVHDGSRATPLAAVLRRDAPATIDASRSRAQEHTLLAAARDAGVTVPRPLGFCDDTTVIGAPFSLAERVAGTALGPRVVKRTELGGDREALVERLGAELAAIHSIDPERASLGFLGRAPDAAAPGWAIERLRDSIDALGAVRPALEAGLRRLELSAPASGASVLLHRDFRTGNLMLDDDGLVAILDWEFADLGDPMEDIGWFCARCWRFSRPDLDAGGLGSREAFVRGYEAAGGARVDAAAVRWWEAFAHARWAVIALQQGARHASGRERSLSLALTGRLADALELHLLDATLPVRSPMPAPDDAGRAGDADAAPPASSDGPSACEPADAPTPLDAALLDAARETLETMARDADGDDRVALLMGAAAMATALRETDCIDARRALRQSLLEASGMRTARELARAARGGTLDGVAAADAALLNEAALHAWVARPRELDAELRRRRGLRSGTGPPVPIS